ncbi:Phage derived protein Gp49-like [Dyadobacter soli]|uniref:Phage derived protein Gp49-like n=1 Tax=Dyadobacter soli TaxID=659014 RepID=A0A1G6XXC1_9BACT|nr:type II toxin-antitoxin system RelE/ParE family toxin [Dyadobacter soli]SDD82077.1 Phage derived protein Gp49-like [Dyadobacter soli]
MEGSIREIFYYKHYYRAFFATLKPEAKKKFNWTLNLLTSVQRIPEKFLKHVEGSSGLYEIRVDAGSDIYRVFCFFDKGQIIVLGNGFQKKTPKTPRNELKLAEKLKNEYFDEKRQ